MSETCPSCGATIDATFCGACGERRASQRVYSLREFAHEAFETLTNVERSFLHTLWTLVRRPGELTAAYMRGARVRYLRPLQLFLLVNVVFFVWAGWAKVHVFTTRLPDHLHSPYRVQARRVYAERQPRSGRNEREYRLAFDQKGEVLARTLIIVMAPVIAAGVALVSIRRRRPAVQHLVFGVHLLTFVLLATVVVACILILVAKVADAAGVRLTDAGVDSLAGYLMLIAMSAYLFTAFRRSYADSRIEAVLKTVLSLLVLVYILVGYRMLLFYATAYSF